MSRNSVNAPPLAWQNIANTQPHTEDFRVWLTRPLVAQRAAASASPTSTSSDNDDKTPWQPLRHVDCQTLRDVMQKGTPYPVHIEGGRATADPVGKIVFENFVRSTQRSLCDAVWFIVDDETKKSKKETLFWPIRNRDDEDKIEALYQNAVILINEGIPASGLQEASPPVTLSNNATVRIIVQGHDVFLRQTAPGWFAHAQRLQRGYGPYTVPGEAEEQQLGPVRSLAIVVHGIGEKYFSNSSQTSFPSLLEQTQTMRVALQKQQLQAHEQACEAARKAGRPSPGPPGRIELLPIEWFEALHNDQSEVMQSLQAVTLPSIPALRTIANDIIFDVLVYLTPAFCQAVLEKVQQQIKTLYQAFCKVHTGFDGPVTLMGHSLGSVIVWDLLSLRREQNSSMSSSNAWGPSVVDRTKLQEPLPFEVDTCIFLGSPIGMFLSLRGARAAFDELRRCDDQDGAGTTPNPTTKVISPFRLPVQRLVNIFNASDPVAYRIEPLLVAPGTTTDIPPPAYLTAPGKDVRLHVKARQLGDGVRKALLEPTSAWSAVLGAVAAAAIDSDTTNRGSGVGSGTGTGTGTNEADNPSKFPLGGASERVDYALQPALVDNEYISAVLAHSTTGYLLNADFLAYLVHHM